jgi:hypothetical protein
LQSALMTYVERLPQRWEEEEQKEEEENEEQRW